MHSGHTMFTRPRHGDAPARRTFRDVRLALAGLVILSVGVFVTPTVATSASSGWKSVGLHVVGGPVVADNMILVVNITASRELELSAVNPSDGTTAWSSPFSQSGITGGVAFAPVAIGSVVLGLSPDQSEGNPLTYLQGLDVVTGKPVWTLSTALGVADAPLLCGGGKYFCLTVFDSSGRTGLIELNPLTGQPVVEVPNLQRSMGVSGPGTPNTTTLWQNVASAPTFVETSTSGHVVWTRKVSALFGGTQFGPNYGWDFIVTRGLDIGSVGVAPKGKTDYLNEVKIVGVSTVNGAVKWSSPGMYQCMGTLQFLSSDVKCDYSGPATIVGSSESFKGTRLTLEGFNPASGAVTWSEPVLNITSLSLGTNIAFVDSTHVVVEDTNRQWLSLDTQNGTTKPVVPGQTFWCASNPFFNVIALTGVANTSQRASTSVFRGCSAKGAPVSTLPKSTPQNVGVLVSGKFVWTTPSGLTSVSATP